MAALLWCQAVGGGCASPGVPGAGDPQSHLLGTEAGLWLRPRAFVEGEGAGRDRPWGGLQGSFME